MKRWLVSKAFVIALTGSFGSSVGHWGEALLTADINPLSYGYEAIFANEFSRINVSRHRGLADSQFTCDGSYIM
jgi:hypothetical protein